MKNHEVTATEPVTRFVFSKSQVNFSKNKLKYTAFIPPKKYPNEISVFRNSTLTEEKTWEIGFKVAEKREKPLLGRGDLLVAEVSILSVVVSKKMVPVWPFNSKVIVSISPGRLQ